MLLQWVVLWLSILLWKKCTSAFVACDMSGVVQSHQGRIQQRRREQVLEPAWVTTTSTTTGRTLLLQAAESGNHHNRINQKTYIPPAIRESLKQHGHKYYCTTCAVGFAKQINHQEHMAGKTHQRLVSERASVWHDFVTGTPAWARTSNLITTTTTATNVDADDADSMFVLSNHNNNNNNNTATIDVHTFWRDSELSDFPHRKSCIDPVWTIDTISPQLRGRFWRYLRDSFGNYYPELPSIFHHVSLHAPRYLRVKELFETLEAFKIVSSIILMAEEKKKNTQLHECDDSGGGDDDNTLQKERGSAIDTIYDLACGHGLLGILLAYRFPTKTVVCVDLEARDSFEAFRCAFNEMGECYKGQETPLSNLQYREADLASVEPEVAAAAAAKESTSFLVALHACNEANKDVVDMAQRSDGTMWAVMPCCIRSKLYLNGAPVLDLDADARYQLLCGAFAEANDAQLVRAISRHITARPIVIAGGMFPSDTISSGRPVPISAAGRHTTGDGIICHTTKGGKGSLKKVGYGSMPPL